MRKKRKNYKIASQNIKIICYTQDMKYSLILSLSLVALSAGAGLGLSALHQSTVPTQVSVLTTLQIETGASGFIIPTYVPDSTQSMAVLAALTSPIFDSEIAIDNSNPTNDPVIDVVSKKEIESVYVTLGKEPMVSPRAIVAARSAQISTKPQASVVARFAQPAVVQEHIATNSLKYIIGIYR